MKPLLQHASRSLSAGFALVASSPRPVSEFSRVSICLRCQNRAASTVRSNSRAQCSSNTAARWSQRPFSSSMRWMDGSKPSQPIPVPPPTHEPRSIPGRRVDDQAPEINSSLEGQERLRGEPDALTEKQSSEQSGQTGNTTGPEQPAALGSQERLREDLGSKTKKDDIADNIRRVPDEHLPSHRERQRWDFSKRFSEIMDDVLPKLAVVTQKVNTYTGTDYSGVEALRREIKEQGVYCTGHKSDVANNDQRTSSRLAEPPSIQQSNHSMSHTPSKPPPRRRSSPCSSASTHGPRATSNDTCLSSDPNTSTTRQ